MTFFADNFATGESSITGTPLVIPALSAEQKAMLDEAMADVGLDEDDTRGRRWNEDQPRVPAGSSGGGQFGGGSGTPSSVKATDALRPLMTLTPDVKFPMTWMMKKFATDSGRHYAMKCTDGKVIKMIVTNAAAENGPPTDEDAQRVLSKLADLHDQYPQVKIPQVYLCADGDGPIRYGVGGATHVEPNGQPYILLNGPELGVGGRTPVIPDKGWTMMPSGDSDMEYTVTHEFGHALDNTEKNVRTGALAEQLIDGNKVHGYAASQPAEAYAELFADWERTGGSTTKQATKSMAVLAGWSKP